MKTTRLVVLIFVLSIVGFGSLSHPHTAHATPSTYPITGYAWSENIGWVDLNCSNTVGLCSTSPFGLTVDPSGNITGYAWSENIGWISANPSDLSGCPQAPCTATIAGGALSGWMKVLSADGTSTPVIAIPNLQTATTATRVILTSGSSWTVPADWNSASNTIEVIGAGASGVTAAGGGGGAYSKISNLTLSGNITYHIGSGATGDTWFNGATFAGSSVAAKGGSGSTGGAAASGIGSTKYSGGNASYGGGGAAGSFGDGGGGGSGGGGGDNGHGGAGGAKGADAPPGSPDGCSAGSGGGGGSGTEWGGSYGSGGGGGWGGSTYCNYGHGGNGGGGGYYGGGGGAGALYANGGTSGGGGGGGQGIIVITYYAATTTYTYIPATSTGWSGFISLSSTSSPSNQVQTVTGSSIQSTTTVVSFAYTGSDQTFPVPANVYSISIKAWGAGGGGGVLYSTATKPGGGGGFASGSLTVSPAQVLTIIVGKGGVPSASAGYGGGGAGGPTGGAQGGGRSAVRNNSGTELLTAGGGGGGSSSTTYENNTGGPGGGTTGGTGSSPCGQSGGGGTQAAGGCASGFNGATAGSQFQGGTGAGLSGAFGSGGGGGYYGGGGANVGVGGGGSGYVGGVTSSTLTSAVANTPANSGDANYIASVGVGGTAPGGTGGNGLVVITYTATTTVYTYSTATATTPPYGITASGGVISGFSWSDDVMGWTDWHFASTTYGICTPSYSCSGNQITYTNSSCVTSNFGSMCVAPAFCSPGSSSCLYPNPSVTGALTLSPKLVPTGKTTQVSWNISNVQSCSVTGTNKDGTGNNATGLWNTLSGTKTSSAITGQTTYTLSCVPDDPAAPLFTQSVTLNLVPTYQEK